MAAVALVAHQWRTGFQQIVGNRTVGHMAVCAVIAHRAVVMNKGAALFHMALVAGLDYAVALHEFGACRAVGVMAV